MSSQALTQFPLENDLGLLRRTTAEKTASPKKSNKKTLDKRLARLATAPVKPVAGANAGPAKIAAAFLPMAGAAFVGGSALMAAEHTRKKWKKDKKKQKSLRTPGMPLLARMTAAETPAKKKTAALIEGPAKTLYNYKPLIGKSMAEEDEAPPRTKAHKWLRKRGLTGAKFLGVKPKKPQEKTASRASRKGDLSLLRRTTKEKTASMKKTAYMEKRAAAKRGLAQVLEKNAMVKEAAIQLMVKEAFMCELYRIEEATGDWRLSHSLAFQEDKILEEFEKQAFIRALGAGISAGAKSGWKGFQLARAGGQGFGQAIGAGMRQAAPAFTAARTAKAGALQVAKNVKDTAKTTAVATKASKKAVKPAKNARDAAVAESRAAGGTPEAQALAGREAYTAQTAASQGVLSEARIAEQAAKKAATPAPAFQYNAKGQMLPSGGRQSRNARKARQKAIKKDYMATQKDIAATPKGSVMTPAAANKAKVPLETQPIRHTRRTTVQGDNAAFRQSGSHGPLRVEQGMTAAQQERQIMIANRARAGNSAKIPGKAPPKVKKVTPAANPGAEVQATKGKGTSIKEQNVASQGKPAGDPGAVKETGGAVKETGAAGEGVLGGKTFTEGTMPTWMPKGVSDKWAALTPEQRRLWAIGGAAGAGGLTAGAVLG